MLILLFLSVLYFLSFFVFFSETPRLRSKKMNDSSASRFTSARRRSTWRCSAEKRRARPPRPAGTWRSAWSDRPPGRSCAFDPSCKFCKFVAGSVSAVSKPIFGSKYAFGSIFQVLNNLHTFAPLHTQHFSKQSVKT